MSDSKLSEGTVLVNRMTGQKGVVVKSDKYHVWIKPPVGSAVRYGPRDARDLFRCATERGSHE